MAAQRTLLYDDEASSASVAHSINKNDDAFDEEASEADSETVISMPGKGFEPDSSLKFQSIPVVWVLLLEVAILVAYCVLLFMTSSVTYPIDAFFFSILLHIIVFIIVLLISFYVEYFFRRVRFLGHLEFYRTSRTQRRLPVIVLSLGHVLILLLVCLWPNDGSAGLDSIDILKGIVTIEDIIIIINLFFLGRKVYRFNKCQPSPDASEELVPGFEAVNVTQGQRNAHDLGFSEEDYLDEVMEKQGDMIKYLQQQKENLSLRIVQLTEKLRQYEQENDEPTTTDFQYLLKTKDQEMRLALADRNQTIQRLEGAIRTLTLQQEQLTMEKEQLRAQLRETKA